MSTITVVTMLDKQCKVIDVRAFVAIESNQVLIEKAMNEMSLAELMSEHGSSVKETAAYGDKLRLAKTVIIGLGYAFQINEIHVGEDGEMGEVTLVDEIIPC